MQPHSFSRAPLLYCHQLQNSGSCRLHFRWCWLHVVSWWSRWVRIRPSLILTGCKRPLSQTFVFSILWPNKGIPLNFFKESNGFKAVNSSHFSPSANSLVSLSAKVELSQPSTPTHSPNSSAIILSVLTNSTVTRAVFCCFGTLNLHLNVFLFVRRDKAALLWLRFYFCVCVCVCVNVLFW